MAFCPECNAEIATTATSCNACGYDFSPPAKDAPSQGWEYSQFAEVSLIVGAICSIIVSIICAYIFVIGLIERHYQTGLLNLLFAILAFAMCVVFLRVKK